MTFGSALLLLLLRSGRRHHCPHPLTSVSPSSSVVLAPPDFLSRLLLVMMAGRRRSSLFFGRLLLVLLPLFPLPHSGSWERKKSRGINTTTYTRRASWTCLSFRLAAAARTRRDSIRSYRVRARLMTTVLLVIATSCYSHVRSSILAADALGTDGRTERGRVLTFIYLINLCTRVDASVAVSLPSSSALPLRGFDLQGLVEIPRVVRRAFIPRPGHAPR